MLLQLCFVGESQFIIYKLATELLWGGINAVESSLWARVCCCDVRRLLYDFAVI
jgi:hypothetical protein